MLSAKSPGLIWYEQEEAVLLADYRAGWIDSHQFFTAVMSALSRASWAMNETERQGLQRDLQRIPPRIFWQSSEIPSRQ
jgi:hypothetical protein